jgi:hypothetical protein
VARTFAKVIPLKVTSPEEEDEEDIPLRRGIYEGKNG